MEYVEQCKTALKIAASSVPAGVRQPIRVANIAAEHTQAV